MEIQICSTCKGNGNVLDDVGTHNTEWVSHICSNCKGTGRVQTRSFRYTVPFGTNDSLIDKFDSEICKMIRELESKAK